MNKFKLGGLLLLLVILTFVLTAYGAEEKPIFHLTILHTNDFHGYDLTNLARQATLIKEIRSKEANVLLFNAGDVFTRGKYQYHFYGELEFAVLNALGTDALTLGNNEFKATNDLTAQQYLFARINQAKFPVLCANVLMAKDGSYLPNVKPYTVINVKGVKIGVLGVTANRIGQYRQTNGFTVLDQIETVKSIYPKVAAQSDIVLALTHIGFQYDWYLAKAVPNLAAIVGGDSHTLIVEPERVGRVPIVQAGANGAYLGRLDLYFQNKGKGWVLQSFQGRVIRINKKIKEDSEIMSLIDRYLAKLRKAA